MAAVNAVTSAETQNASIVQQMLQQALDSQSTSSGSAVENILGDSVTRLKDFYTPSSEHPKSAIYTMLELHNKSKGK
jgi:hypothetical protein